VNWIKITPNIYNDMPFKVITPTAFLLILSVHLHLYSFLPCFPFKNK